MTTPRPDALSPIEAAWNEFKKTDAYKSASYTFAAARAGRLDADELERAIRLVFICGFDSTPRPTG